MGLTTTTLQVILLAGSWMVIGLATAMVLKRRGHEFGPNAALGIILGPIFVFLAFDMVRRRESDKPIRVSESAKSTGQSVLVVVVGELPDPGTDIREVIASVGEFGTVTVAVPVEYEVAERVHGMGKSPPSSEILDEVAEALDDLSPGKMMLPGRVETSIAAGVRETGAELVLLVGSESSSITSELDRKLDIPVVRIDTAGSPDSTAS